ncbi:MAG TPA: DNA-3-methyladenine glycosylase 2 family protein [Acetobacteraceae bacterium]|nr:DNA-3-methyladenine glycosylase 2 family protein [Acetobacteraceae bacterium]
MFPHPPAPMRAALDALVAADPRLAVIEAQAGPLPWRTRPRGFAGLLQAITAQQISNQAASAIWRRVTALPGAMTPAGLLALPEAALRGAGLSRPKVAHAASLARAYLDGRLDDAAIDALEDEAALEAITAVPGLGPWTAEVYLLFALQRRDVFPAGDIAVAGAAAALLGLASRPDVKTLRGIAEAWRPSRALAARLLWHHWRHLTGRPSMDEIALPGGVGGADAEDRGAARPDHEGQQPL